ncbi:hypothetical protein GCM10023093_05030 [Nemorincola caseinilytica]|uniref:Tetratricopeptide repeat protein n=1 Tax=Nemorincola caseinilytica TaxID=2054315 RepID=A0ABP8N477_9BACT
MLLPVFVFLYAVASAQPAAILYKSYAQQWHYVDSLGRNTRDLSHEQRMTMLDQQAGWADNNRDITLASLLRRRKYAIEINTLSAESPALEEKMLQLVITARNNELRAVEADAMQLMAHYWVRFHKLSLAFQNYQAAYHIYKPIPAAEFPKKREYIYELGGMYYRYEENSTALRYLKEALNTSAPDDAFVDPILNNIGLCYRRMKEYDSAEHYFRLIYHHAKRINNPAWEGIATGNIGITYFYRKKYDEAIPLIEKDITLSTATGQIRNAAESYYMLSCIYFERNDLAKTRQLLEDALRLCRPRPFWPDHALAEKIYRQLYKTYAAEGNMRMAYLYADSTLNAKDSVVAMHNAENLARARERIEFIQKKLEAEQLLSQKRAQLIIRNSLIAAIVLLTIIGIMFINRQRLRQKKLLAEKTVAEKELHHAEAQLDNFKRSVQEKNNLLEQFAIEIERIKQGQVQESDNELLSQLEKATILTDEQWEHFREVFEKVHKGFFANLKRKIPDLTPSEVRFLALTKLKLSPKEMASMLGISANAIRIYRHRLRRKLDMDKEGMIEELVDDL